MGKTRARRQTRGKPAEKRLPKREFYLVVAAVAVLGAALMYFGFGLYPSEKIAESRGFEKYPGILFEYEVTRYPAAVSIIDTNKPIPQSSDLVSFGVLANNEDYITKFINLENLREEPVKMNLIARGDIGRGLTFARNGFVLQPGEKATVGATFRPADLPAGTYLGDIEIVVKIAKHPALMQIW